VETDDHDERKTKEMLEFAQTYTDMKVDTGAFERDPKIKRELEKLQAVLILIPHWHHSDTTLTSF
jgi:hypothetical protein